MIQCSLGSSAIDSCIVISLLFPICYYFLAKRPTTFSLLKTDVLFYMMFSKKGSHILTLSLSSFNKFQHGSIDFNKTNSKK